MWLLTVTPISRGIAKENLYYFSSKPVKEGDLIEATLRSRVIIGKVESIKLVADAKAELKSLPFALKKVSTLTTPHFFSEPFMRASRDTANYFGSALGAVLYSLLPPKRILNDLFSNSKEENTLPESLNQKAVYVTQCNDEERLSEYRRIIREEFAKKKSVFLIAPTITESIKLHKEIKKGLEDYTYLMHQRLAKRNISEVWKNAINNNHPILLIATPNFLGLPRKDIGTIILERESSSFYKKDSRPFVDFRVFAKFLAKYYQASIIFGDSMIRSETYHELETGMAIDYSKISFRNTSSVNVHIINHKNQKNLDKYSTLSDEIKEMLVKNKEGHGRFLIISPRRGLSPRTFCRDCGKSVSCPSCGGTLVLHGKGKNFNDSPFYVCHRCGTEITSLMRCTNCQSWNLIPFGSGSEKIEKEIIESLPEVKVFRLDKDNMKSETNAEKIVHRFLSSPGSVMVGTELALSRITENVENVAVIFPELFSTSPEYNTEENALRLILRSKNLALKNFVIETTDPELPIIKQAENPNILDFYRKELEIRKLLNYPPFSIMILISWKISEDLKKQISELFKDYSPIFFQDKSIDNKKEEKALIRLKTDSWPENTLREKLLSLPINVKIEIMPDKIFG
jgi:primosomal protein N' (replication factor Y)